MKKTTAKFLLCLSLSLYSGVGFAADAGSTFDPSLPPCGPGSASDTALVKAMDKEVGEASAVKDKVDEEAKAEASCQISFNLDGIRNSIPAALKGVWDLLSGFNPTDVFGRASKMVGDAMTSNNACRIAKNALNDVQRVAVNAGKTVAVNAVNDAETRLTNRANDALKPINDRIYDANGNLIKYGGNPKDIVAPISVRATTPLPPSGNTTGGGVWNKVACTFGGGTNCTP